MSSLRRASWGGAWERNTASSIWFCAQHWELVLLLHMGGPGASMPHYEAQRAASETICGICHPKWALRHWRDVSCHGRVCLESWGVSFSHLLWLWETAPAELLSRLNGMRDAHATGRCQDRAKDDPQGGFTAVQGRAKDKAIVKKRPEVRKPDYFSPSSWFCL